MPVAVVSNLTVRYGAKTAIDALSVEVPEGCVGLLGPNGAGKTTLIKTLLGFVRPASGSARTLEFDAASQDMQVRQRTGLMPVVDPERMPPRFERNLRTSFGAVMVKIIVNEAGIVNS